MLAPGDRVKDYEVIAPLRSGGMAMLYLARRRGVGGFSRLVALKLVHRHLLADESITRLFLDEARISATVAHPNVVNVEEVGLSGDGYFIAMEYVHGVSLSELLASLSERRLRMSSKLCVWVAGQVAEALHAAHEAKSEDGTPLCIVHRDVSPQNVLIGHTGHVKLIDFGIANSQVSKQAEPGRAVLGKLGYMAPEQLRMEPADRRTDVYALGVMLWEMLTARSLFRCLRVDDERDWKTRESPPPPSLHAPSCSPELDRVVQKALACDPAQRFENAIELRAALLRAESSAAQVDAPMFAALMCTLLGDELERRRANWPSEVSVQLDLDAEITTLNKSWSLEDLTAEIAQCDAPVIEVEEESEPTIADSPASRRGKFAASIPLYLPAPTLSAAIAEERVLSEGLMPENIVAEGIALSALSAPWSAISLPRRTANSNHLRMQRAQSVARRPAAASIVVSREAEIVTVPSPVSKATLPGPLQSLLRSLRARFALVGLSCIGLGIVFGVYVSRMHIQKERAALMATLRAPQQRTALTSRTEPFTRSVVDGGRIVREVQVEQLETEQHAARPRSRRAALLANKSAKRASSSTRISTRASKATKSRAAIGGRSKRSR